MMKIPLSYSIRNLGVRWVNTLVGVLGIAGVVGVFVITLAMARGFQATIKASGSPQNAMITRAGATAELESAITLEQVKALGDFPEVARDHQSLPLLSPEVVVIAALPLIATGTDANVQVRGVKPTVLQVRENVRIAEGRFLQSGLPELVVGKNAVRLYENLELNAQVEFGGLTWTVVGILDAGGTAFDSELWADAVVLNESYQRPRDIFQSCTVRLQSPESFQAYKDGVTSDPRFTVQAEREIDYYGKQSEGMARMINVLGSMIAMVMSVGAIFGALNTMFASVASRSREIATLGALGFPRSSIIAAFQFESLVLATLGWAVGSVAVLPFNGYTASTINWGTFSHVGFAFQITPPILFAGLLFAWVMGSLSGFLPAWHAARQSIPSALRGL